MSMGWWTIINVGLTCVQRLKKYVGGKLIFKYLVFLEYEIRVFSI